MPQRIYARQIPPEQQESSIYLNDYCEVNEDIVIYGNDGLNGLGTEVDAKAKALYDMPEEIKDAEGFTEKQVEYLTKSASDNTFGQFLVDYLSEKNGMPYKRHLIRGCVQREWNYLYVPESYEQSTIDEIEAMYFNVGAEVESCLTDDDINSPNDIECGDYGYFVGTEDDIVKELRKRYEVGDDVEVVLWMFDGWTRTPKYKRAE